MFLVFTLDQKLKMIKGAEIGLVSSVRASASDVIKNNQN